MIGISRLALTQAVVDRLETLDGVTVYTGEVDTDDDHRPPLLTDGSGRVAPYVVIYPAPGAPDERGRDAADTWTDLDWLIQVTVAAGYLLDVLAVLDDVDDLLHRWAPVIDGVSCEPLRPPLGYSPGPVRRDQPSEGVLPRHYVPLQYRLTATR